MKTSKQKFIRLLLLGAISMMAFSACIKEREIGGGTASQGESSVRFSVRLPGASHASRALTDDNESHVQTIDILMFEQGGGAWKYKAGVSGSAIATDGTDATKKTFTITMRHGDYDLVMLANARERIVALDLEGKTKSQVLAALAEDAPVGGKWIADVAATGYKPIPMWGEIGDITIDGSTEITDADDITLTRMVARVDVKIAPAVSNFTITSVDVYNYNTKGSLAPLPTAWNSSANPPRATAPNVPAGSTLTKGPLEYNNKDGKSEVNTTGNECASEIYIFESENHTGAGHAAGKDHLDRTCIVVGGVYGTDAEPTYYRADFSTGTGDGETFLDVLRNHHYTFTVTKVSGSGYATSEDAFQGSKKIEITVSVTDWGAENRFPLGLKIQPSANCYLVAPGETFGIPVFGQVQRAMDAGDLSSDWITNDMDLKAHFLWSDNSEVNGVVNTSKLRVIKSSSSQSTTMLVETGNKTGNAVVAIYEDKNNDDIYDKDTEEVKWSWHIWVTDYDPDKQINGTTHVYAGDAFTSGIYVGKRIMDRNLGATWTGGTPTPPTTAAQAAKAYGLMYQWGRKDPFTPANGTVTGVPTQANGGIVTIYNASGATLSENGTGVKLVSIPPSTANNLPNAVRNPLTFYFNATSPYDWYNNTGAKNDNLWCENGATSTAGSKTAYDPCPPGWRVPLGGAAATNNPWAGFGNGVANSTAQGTNAIFSWYINGANLGESNATTNNATAGRYYTGNGANAWHPATGYRNYYSGGFDYVGTHGYYWSAATTTGGYSYNLIFYSSLVAPAGSSARANGFPVRCIQDDSYNPTPAGPTLTTDSEDRKILTDGNTYNIKVTSNTTWIASIKRGTNEVTIGDSEVLGLPLLNEETGFNDGLVTSYVGGGTAGTTTEKTITVKTVDYYAIEKYAEGDFVIVFRDANVGNVIHETKIKVWQGIAPYFARSNIVMLQDDSGNKILTFAEQKEDNVTNKTISYIKSDNSPITVTIPAMAANVQGLYFRWGSLMGIISNGTPTVSWNGSPTNGFVVFVPEEYTGIPATWVYTSAGMGIVGQVPVLDDTNINFSEATQDAFKNKYATGTVGYDAVNGLGDICRYITAKGWVNGDWRMPTQAEYQLLYEETRTTTAMNGIKYGSIENDFTTITGVGADGKYGYFPIINARMVGLGVTSGDGAAHMTCPGNGRVVFPASGNIHHSNGNMSYTGYDGDYWSVTPSSTTNSYRFRINANTSVPGATSSRNFGYQIRCIRDVK